MKRQRGLLWGYYTLIGTTAMLGMITLLYGALRADSSLFQLVLHHVGDPIFIWTYMGTSIAIAVTFGLSVALIAYRWRRYGSPLSWKQSSGMGIGALLGMLASSCPVCGSTALSMLSIMGGLSALPLQGIEIKIVSLVLMTISLAVLVRDMRNPCTHDTCPVSRADIFKKYDYWYTGGLIAILTIVTITLITLLQTEPLIVRDLQYDPNQYSCSQHNNHHNEPPKTEPHPLRCMMGGC